MTLDERVRAALRAQLDPLEVPAFEEPVRREPDQRRRTSLQLVLASIAILGVLAAWIALRVDPAVEPATPSDVPEHAPGDPIPLSEIPQGVSAHRIGWQPTFFVRDGHQITVFLTDPQHLPGELTLWWCPNEKVFAAPTHGELFAADGTRLAGPGNRGLSRLPSRIEANALHVDGDWNQTPPIEGSTVSRPHDEHSLPPELDAMNGESGWNSGPGSFCQEPTRSGRSDRFQWRDEDHGSDPMACDDVTEATYGGTSDRVRSTARDALDEWLSWNETWFGSPGVGERPGSDPPVFVVVLDGRVQMEIHSMREADGYRISGYAHCTESFDDLFAVSEKERAAFGSLVTMPVCEPPEGPLEFGGPATDDDPARCRWDADLYETSPVP